MSFKVTILRAEIVRSANLQRTYSHEMYYGEFTIKQEIQFRKHF